MISFEDMPERLKNLGLTRQWLAQESGRKESSISSAFAPNAAPHKRSDHLQRALSDAIKAEENRRQSPPKPDQLPDRISLEVPPEKYELWDQAATDARLTTKQWAIHELNRAAREWQEEQRLRSLSLVTEEPATYHTDTTKKA
jgi:hypothetical protein